MLVDADLVIGFEAAHLAAASDVGGADTERVLLLLDLPVLLQGIRADPDAVPLASARNVVERMMQRRGSAPSVRAAELADPYGAPRHAFAEMARVVDAMVGLLASSLFAPQRQRRRAESELFRSGRRVGERVLERRNDFDGPGVDDVAVRREEPRVTRLQRKELMVA